MAHMANELTSAICGKDRDQKRIGAHLNQLRKARIDVTNGASIQDIDVLPNAAGSGLNIT